jgi:hypothetical protein
MRLLLSCYVHVCDVYSHGIIKHVSHKTAMVFSNPNSQSSLKENYDYIYIYIYSFIKEEIFFLLLVLI